MARWIQVKPSDGTAAPPLFLSSKFTHDSYEVRLTDLQHVWCEVLPRKGIIKRALIDETCIDPSEGADQLQLLLKYIRECVEGQNGSTLSIQPSSKAESLQLESSMDLPGGVGPLRWQMNLESSTQSTITSEIVLPLLKAQASNEDRLSRLYAELEAKDNVIRKLEKSLDSNGVSLASAFPAAAGNKAVKRGSDDSLKAAVPGFQKFDRHTWQASQSQSVKVAVPSFQLTFPESLDTYESSIDNNEWFTSGVNLDFPGSLPTTKNKKQHYQMVEDSFPQSTPLSASSPLALRPQSQLPLTEQEDIEMKDPAPATAAAEIDSMDGSTEDEDFEKDTRTPATKKPAALPTPPSKSKQPIREKTPPRKVETVSALPPATSKPKLGMLGGKKDTSTTDAKKHVREREMDREAERGKSKDVDMDSQDETILERADRKRSELKMEMEQKAAQVKKKRRF